MSDFIPIYAVDFDGTLCESAWPGIGKPNEKLINHLIKRRSEGAKLILWTCRVEERLQEAVEWCKAHGLEFDAVNDNIPEMVECHNGSNSRKIWATCYIDDCAVDKAKYGLPYHPGAEREIQEEPFPIGSEWDFEPIAGLDKFRVYVEGITETRRGKFIRVQSAGHNGKYPYYSCSREEEWFLDKLFPIKRGGELNSDE